MEDILVTKENGLFYADITDEFKEERLIICARTKEDFVDLIKKEINDRCRRGLVCLDNYDESGYARHYKWAKAMHDVLVITNFM